MFIITFYIFVFVLFRLKGQVNNLLEDSEQKSEVVSRPVECVKSTPVTKPK